MRLCLEYFDHNERFAPLLPKEGTVERWLKSVDGSDWVLFHLDTAVEYENRSYDYFLLKSRWAGPAIGGPKPTSVFVLLVTDPEKVEEGFDAHHFDHVAWGMVRAL